MTLSEVKHLIRAICLEQIHDLCYILLNQNEITRRSHAMFENIGGKIKKLAKIICWIGIIISALSGIVLVAMVPTLSIAAIISRNLYKRTGNIWMAGCLNAMLMTTMTIANTMVAYK